MAQVVDRAVRMLEDWKPANNISSNAHAVHDRNNSNDPQVSAGLGHNYHAAPAVMSDSDSNQMRWQPPAHGRVKCNMDAAFSEHRNNTGISLCIRDEEGTFILAKIMPFIRIGWMLHRLVISSQLADGYSPHILQTLRSSLVGDKQMR